MSVQKNVIRACLLYEFKLGSNATEASRKICTAFGENAVTDRTARNWFRKFALGDETLEDARRAGRPSDFSNDDLRTAIETNSKLTCQELATTFNVSDETIRLHLHELGKRWKLSRWVPHELSHQNKIQRLTTCISLISRFKAEPFLDRILTCDEKWVMYSNVKRSHHWLSSNEPVPQSSKPHLTPQKLLLCIWWTSAGVIHHEYLNVGQTITADIYCAQLQRVQDKLRIKQPALLTRKKVLFLQDNAKPHTARITLNKLMELEWEIMPHPPYSPDLSPSDYHLFLSLDNHMRNKTFNDADHTKQEISNFLQDKTVDFYKRGIYKLPNRWEKVVECDGSYFDE